MDRSSLRLSHGNGTSGTQASDPRYGEVRINPPESELPEPVLSIKDRQLELELSPCEIRENECIPSEVGNKSPLHTVIEPLKEQLSMWE